MPQDAERLAPHAVGLGEFAPRLGRAVADGVALALEFRDEFRHAVGGVGGRHGIVVDVGVEVVAVRVVGLDQRVVARRRIVVLFVGIVLERVHESGEGLELALVGVPAGVARAGHAVVPGVAQGRARVDVGGIDEVRGDAAGQPPGGGHVVERLGDGDEGGLHGRVSLSVRRGCAQAACGTRVGRLKNANAGLSGDGCTSARKATASPSFAS